MNSSGMAKYVVIRDSHGVESVYVFEGQHQHKCFADKMSGTVVAAGFVVIRGNRVVCTGESMTLGIESRKEDEELIRKLFGLAK